MKANLCALVSTMFLASGCITNEMQETTAHSDIADNIGEVDDFALDSSEGTEQPAGYVSRFDGTFVDLLEITPLDDFVGVANSDAEPDIDFIDNTEMEEAMQMFGVTDLRPRAFFVSKDVTSVRNAASRQGKVVKILRAGDRIVGTIQGQWAKIGDKEFAPISDLSLRPVAAGDSKTTRLVKPGASKIDKK